MNHWILLLVLGCFCCLAIACGDSAPNTNRGTNPTVAATPAPAATTAPGGPPSALTVFNVEWVSQTIPSEMQVGKAYEVPITIKNPTNVAWPARGAVTGTVNVAYHWLPAQGEKPVVVDGERTSFPRDIAPGETIKLDKVRVVPPSKPGAYRLQISLVQEGITWFESQGAKPLTVPVTVR